MKILSSFAVINTGEGKRISYTYSEFGETGKPQSRNNRESVLVLSDDVAAHIAAIEQFVTDSYLKE